MNKSKLHLYMLAFDCEIPIGSKSYFWPDMTSDVKLFVDLCNVCQHNKVKREKGYGTLSLTGPANEPFDIISIDTLCGFEGYGSKQQFLHLAINNFSRFVWSFSSKTQKSQDFRHLIELVLMIGKPKLILADNFSSIRSNSFRSFLESPNIKIKFISPDCHQSNGMIERVNLTLAD